MAEMPIIKHIRQIFRVSLKKFSTEALFIVTGRIIYYEPGLSILYYIVSKGISINPVVFTYFTRPAA